MIRSSWHQHRLGRERLQYLADLPYILEFMMSGKWIRLFHASPRAYERIQPWDGQEKLETLFHSSRWADPRIADVAGYGDIHNAYHQHLDGERYLIPARRQSP